MNRPFLSQFSKSIARASVAASAVLISVASGCVAPQASVSWEGVVGMVTNPVLEANTSKASPTNLVLGVPRVTGPFADRYRASGYINVTNESRERGRKLAVDAVTSALISYLGQSGLFAKVVALQPQLQVDLVLECELLEYHTEVSHLSVSDGQQVTGTRHHKPRINAKFTLSSPSGKRWQFVIERSWPEQTIQRTDKASEAAASGAKMGDEAKRYYTQALADFLGMVLSELESRRDAIVRLEQPKAPPEQPSIVRKEKHRTIRDRWAVVVGINSFEDRRVPSLRFGERDAQAFGEVLVDRCGFDRSRVKVLLGSQAALRNVRSSLGTFLARNVGKDDLVVVFFSGHGAPEPDLSGKSPDGCIKYLIPYDVNKDDLFATAIPMSEIATYFERIEARRIIFFADTCYSGAAGGRTFAMKGSRGVTLGEKFLDEVARGEGRVILTASRASEVAGEDENVKHGIFTHYLLEGLAGKADGNGDKQVTFMEVKKYLDDHVPPHARKLGKNQHPVMKGQLIGDIVLRGAKGGSGQ